MSATIARKIVKGRNYSMVRWKGSGAIEHVATLYEEKAGRRACFPIDGDWYHSFEEARALYEKCGKTLHAPKLDMDEIIAQAKAKRERAQ